MTKAINASKSAEEANSILKANGFDFTIEDVKKVSFGATLSDDDLGKVTGGTDMNQAGAFCLGIGFGNTEVKDDNVVDFFCRVFGIGIGYED